MKPHQVLSLLETIEAAYPNFVITEKKAEVWREQLEPADYQSSLKKLKQHIAEKTFAPNIAEIKVMPKQINEHLEKMKQWECEAKYAGKYTG